MSEQGWELIGQDGQTLERTASRKTRDRWIARGGKVREVWRVGGRLDGDAYASVECSR